jgi:hypothetical protein
MIDSLKSHIIDGENPPVLGQDALAYGHLRIPHSMKSILQLEEMYNLPPLEAVKGVDSNSTEDTDIDGEEEVYQPSLEFAEGIEDSNEAEEDREEETREDIYNKLREGLEDRGIQVISFDEDRRGWRVSRVRERKGREIESISIEVHADVKKVVRRMYFNDYSSKAVDPDIENIGNHGRYQVWVRGGGVMSHIEETYDFEGNRLSRRTVRKAPSMMEMNAGIRAGRIYMQARNEAFYLLQDMEVILRNPKLKNVDELNSQLDRLKQLIKGKEIIDINGAKGLKYDYDEDTVREQIASIRSNLKESNTGLEIDLPVRIGEHTIKEPQL